MRKGIFLSVFMHLLLVLFMALNLSGLFVPEPEITFINVQLVTAPTPVSAAKPAEVKPIKNQQSAAPKEAPKPKKKPKKTPEKGTKVVDATPKNKPTAQPIKPKEPQEQADNTPEQKEEPISRPPVLDKTPDKKPLLKEEGQPTTPAVDQFLQALDFISDIKESTPAQAQGEENPQTLVYDERQKEVAFLKRHIEKNWYRPPGLEALDKLVVVVQIEVNRDGTIASMEIVHSSGKGFFDNSILRAVRKSVPLPIPPEQYDVFKTIQISFNQ